MDFETNDTLPTNSEFAIGISNFIYSNVFYVLVALLWSTLVLFSILGNGLVIFIAIVYKKLNDITSIYIFNLAITDLLFTIFCIPFTTYLYLYDNWYLGVLFCKLNHFMSHASVQSTCLTLTAMTIHRCNLIINNKTMTQTAQTLRKRRHNVLLITAVIWIISFTLSSPDLIYFNVEDGIHGGTNETYSQCSIDSNTHSLLKSYINIAMFVAIGTTYCIPLIVIVSFYCRLISYLSRNQKRLARFKEKNKKSTASYCQPNDSTNSEYIHLNGAASESTSANKKTLKQHQQQQQQQITPSTSAKLTRSQNKKRKVTIMVVLVTINFAFCWFPTHLFIIIKRSLNIEANSDAFIYLSLFKIIAHTLSYLTPVVNPCLYAFFNENFRTCLDDIWLKISCKSEPFGRSTYNNHQNNHRHNNNHNNAKDSTLTGAKS